MWFGNDFTHLAARLDGAPAECSLGAHADFCVVPAGVEFSGDFLVGPKIEYTAVFIEPGFIQDAPRATFAHPKLGFAHAWSRQTT